MRRGSLMIPSQGFHCMHRLSLHTQVKQIQAEENAETVPSPSSTVAKPRLTQHRAVRTTFAPTSNSSGGNHAANSSSVNAAESSSGQEVNRRASHASAGTSKPSVPLLNLARQDGGLQVGFGSAGALSWLMHDGCRIHILPP